jgi:hypothetical protein
MTLAIVSRNAVSQECLPYMLQVYCICDSLTDTFFFIMLSMMSSYVSDANYILPCNLRFST